MQKEFMKRFSVAAMAVLLSSSALPADLAISLQNNPTQIFLGENRSIGLVITNRAEEAKVSLDYRIFQLATGIGAPLGPRALWKEIPLHAGQTILESLKITIPKLKAPTKFALKLFETGQGKEITTLTFNAYPTDLLSQLKETLKDHQLALFDEMQIFAPALEKAGVEFLKVKNLSDPILADKPVFLIVAANPEAGEIADLSKVTVAIIQFASEGRDALDQLPIEGHPKNKAYVVECDPSLFRDFAQAPESQINLIRAVQYALRRGAKSTIK
jgi:hypothetical protein